MAVQIITGSNANIDISIANTSVKCAFASWSFTLTRGATSATTFCSSGWVSEIPGMKQGVGSLIGYSTKGVAYSDPSIWVTSASSLAVILTADTNCSFTMSANFFSDGADLVAAANSARGVSFRSDGVVTTAWVVA